MVEVVYPQDDGEPVVVDLRDPFWAAFLAWLWPGAGHFYQRRFAKGFLFMICVLGTFFYGLGLGRGRVVYASFKQNDFRWHYICQLGAGAVTFPAIAQAIKTKTDILPPQKPRDMADYSRYADAYQDYVKRLKEPFFVLCERYPEESGQLAFHRVKEEDGYAGPTFKDGFMAPPAGPIYLNDMDVLGMWHVEMKHQFEMGTLFCVVAGLLNLLVIYDAFVGPAIITPEQREKMEKKKKRRRRKLEAEENV